MCVANQKCVAMCNVVLHDSEIRRSDIGSISYSKTFVAITYTYLLLLVLVQYNMMNDNCSVGIAGGWGFNPHLMSSTPLVALVYLSWGVRCNLTDRKNVKKY